jgi:hypothetical protein
VAFHSERAYAAAPHHLLAGMLEGAGVEDLIVVSAWGHAARSRFQNALEGSRSRIVDASAVLGDALAAAPALACGAALGLLQRGSWRRAFVLSAGIDGGVGLAVLGSVA